MMRNELIEALLKTKLQDKVLSIPHQSIEIRNQQLDLSRGIIYKSSHVFPPEKILRNGKIYITI